MANKKKKEGESEELTSARELVEAADKTERQVSDDSVEVCGCNAYGGPHKHLDRGIIPEGVEEGA